MHSVEQCGEYSNDWRGVTTLVNAIAPGVCARPASSRLPFKQMDNIANYLRACTELGVPSEDLFQTVALYEGQDMGAVVRNLHSLGRVCQRRPGFCGPVLGARHDRRESEEFDLAEVVGGGEERAAARARDRVHVGPVCILRPDPAQRPAKDTRLRGPLRVTHHRRRLLL